MGVGGVDGAVCINRDEAKVDFFFEEEAGAAALEVEEGGEIGERFGCGGRGVGGGGGGGGGTTVAVAAAAGVLLVGEDVFVGEVEGGVCVWVALDVRVCVLSCGG